MTTPIADSIGQHAAPANGTGTGPQPALPQRTRQTALRDLHDLAIHLNANPLITAIDGHPGMGMQLAPADVDTVLRVIASIEAARIEVPGRGVYGGPDHETIA